MTYIANKRAKSITDLVVPRLSDCKTVLDIGAGSCLIAEKISNISKLKVKPVDVTDLNKTSLDLVVYDGKTLPFKEKSFDCGLLVFVLHHAEDEHNLLKEAMRVSRKRIIILEDTPRNNVEKFAWQKIDYYMNNHKHKDINIAHGTKSIQEWNAVLRRVGAKKIETKSFRRFALNGRMYQHTLFTVEVP